MGGGSARGRPADEFVHLFLNSSTANTFTNSLGIESGHANAVGNNFFGLTNGVATNVAHVNNYDADTFANRFVGGNRSISERIVNQSFTYGTYDTDADQAFDNYAAAHNTLFISGAGFAGQPVYSPATCYNGIGVGILNNSGSPNGPTSDGRSKPDITAPNTPDNQTSYSTPRVAGAAALLMQAGLRGDGGNNTNAATDIRTLKALLLNGAIKPTGWTNSSSAPLHFRYGAGVLNVFNSYKQLAGGEHGYIASTTISTGSAHPPNDVTDAVDALSGWDFNTNSSSILNDSVNHYYFNVTNDLSGATFTATATLVWNRQKNQTDINNLDLFLYDCANNNLVTCSTSAVDNVEHIFVPRLPQGRYDLQVWKAGGFNTVSVSEPYALAFEFFSQPLNLTQSETNIALTWPSYPTGFILESTTNLVSSVWRTNNLPVPVVTNNQNYIWINSTNDARFFRLRRP
ncbi:MAG: S8 family serine peptidase [Limisphaerales bacterium]